MTNLKRAVEHSLPSNSQQQERKPAESIQMNKIPFSATNNDETEAGEIGTGGDSPGLEDVDLSALEDLDPDALEEKKRKEEEELARQAAERRRRLEEIKNKFENQPKPATQEVDVSAEEEDQDKAQGTSNHNHLAQHKPATEFLMLDEPFAPHDVPIVEPEVRLLTEIGNFVLNLSLFRTWRRLLSMQMTKEHSLHERRSPWRRKKVPSSTMISHLICSRTRHRISQRKCSLWASASPRKLFLMVCSLPLYLYC